MWLVQVVAKTWIDELMAGYYIVCSRRFCDSCRKFSAPVQTYSVLSAQICVITSNYRVQFKVLIEKKY